MMRAKLANSNKHWWDLRSPLARSVHDSIRAQQQQTTQPSYCHGLGDNPLPSANKNRAHQTTKTS
eukprot:7843881-Lingulodinium_polyedra.AAC.1